MNHKYSTIALVFLIFVACFVSFIFFVISLDSSDIDDLCSQNNKTLVRINGVWSCSNFSYSTNVYNYNFNSSFNQTLTDSIYSLIKWAYNQTYSGSTYNETYSIWSYNQTYLGSIINYTNIALTNMTINMNQNNITNITSITSSNSSWGYWNNASCIVIGDLNYVNQC